MLAKNTHDKYRKYRKNTSCNKIPDLQRKEAKKGPEMSPNIAKIAKVTRIFLATIPEKNLRKFSPSCPLSYVTKLFPKRRLCGKKTPCTNSVLLSTNAQGSGFLLNTQQHCFQGKGEREEPVQLRCSEKCCPCIQFSQQFCPRLRTR